LDWPNDISVIADNLGYDRFGVLGLSGGAPYALSCAYKIPHKLLATAIVSGIGPVDAPGAADGVSANNRQRVILAQKAPWLLSLLLRYVMYKRRRDPEGAFTNLLDSLPDVDRKALNDPRVKVMAMAASSDSLRPGIRGHLLEMRLFAHPWRFSQSDIEAQVLLF
ncbi:MAG: hypothetical protein GTO18_18410, partial [Anaerolineales bacterium]|nr:hypothetical protein [Anaerolineales bacterium]